MLLLHLLHLLLVLAAGEDKFRPVPSAQAHMLLLLLLPFCCL